MQTITGETYLADPRIANFAKVLVERCTSVQPGDRILIEATTAAEPLVRELYIQILEKGGHPHTLLQLPDLFFPEHEDLLLMHGQGAYACIRLPIRVLRPISTRPLSSGAEGQPAKSPKPRCDVVLKASSNGLRPCIPPTGMHRMLR